MRVWGQGWKQAGSGCISERLTLSRLLPVLLLYAQEKKKKVKVVSHSVVSDFCHTMNCSPPGSFVHGISQTRILECVANPFFRGSSPPRDQTQVSCLGRWILNHLSQKHPPNPTLISDDSEFPALLYGCWSQKREAHPLRQLFLLSG